jgi:stage III sporulation protein AE
MALCLAGSVYAKEADVADSSEEDAGPSADDFVESFYDELELSDMEDFLQEQSSEIDVELSFGGLLKELLAGGGELDYDRIASWALEHCLGLVRKNKGYLRQTLLLLLAFALLQGVCGIFSEPFLSEISFLAVYFLFMYNGLCIFSTMKETAVVCLTRIGEFTLVLQPLFTAALLLGAGAGSAGLGYELTILVIYGLQYIIQKLLLPLIFVFLLTMFANYAWKQPQFSALGKLLEQGITLGAKALLAVVLGMNLIRGMVLPALDQLEKNTVAGAISAIPGVGDTLSQGARILYGAGGLIKNGVGAVALMVLVALCAKPVLEIGALTVVYRLLAAFCEPVSDPRVCGMLLALARAGALYLRLLLTGILMLFLTIALVCLATGTAG